MPGGSPVIVSTDNRRETLLRLTAEGRRTVEEVTARRRREIALIVERLSAQQRLALMDALAAFNTAGQSPSLRLPRPSRPLSVGSDSTVPCLANPTDQQA
ncbi:hypothetical protein GCM10010391_72370 [Streptomyces anthocyanicus]|nr:hypothetical protein GCM10010391_72370 [Streptomyces anthocyanicus]